MSVLEELASGLGERGDQPNVRLVEKLTDLEDTQGIREIGAGLRHSDKKVQSDCIKVLYEIGYRKPELVADFAGDFLALLTSKNNRLVWGAMIGLSTIAHLRYNVLFENLTLIQTTMDTGSVITMDAGMKTLSRMAAADPSCHPKIFPWLLDRLRLCRPKSVALYAEFISEAVHPENTADFIQVLELRDADLSPAQQKRVSRIRKNLQ